jgi:uncharacterized protein YndB with AHSA1/START domain
VAFVTVEIHLTTDIAAPIGRVFDLARDLDLHARSMAHTGERAIAGRTSGRIEHAAPARDPVRGPQARGGVGG